MKNIYFSLLFFTVTFLSISQTVRVDYDNSSKWFLGFNGGGTWHSTDVNYQVGGGWGLTLGKSYNYNYGRPLSFDIRGRYLNGNWYGQDKDSTALSGLTQDNALYGYQSTPGYTYHNFKSNIHRLALELAIHLNAITQRTGWDPYVFGGVGITWNQTKGNLTDSSEILLGANPYSYGPNGLGGITFDDSYETPLDGYKKYNVNFMPSLGFGLGYHIGKRTTFGIEHKTTFTLADDFDAVQSTVRPKNDLYHYTSLYLQFRFRGRVNGDYSVGNSSNGNVNGFTSSCPPPVITIANSSNFTVTNPQFDIDFRATEITSQNALQVLNGNNVPVFFNFNTSSKQGRASVTLVPGVNTFTIKARNRCGTDSKTFTVIYNNCSLPGGSFTNPNPTGTIVKSPAFVLGAIVSGIQSKSAIKIYANGNALSNFSYNNQNGVIQANINLNVGLNNFRIELSNACGNGTIESNVTYDNCIAPTAMFLSPSASGTTVNNSNLQLRANVTGVSSNQQISLDINGIATRNFNLTNGLVTANLTLSSGLNTITLRITNSCGTDTEVTTVNYQTCNAPIISVTSPTQNSKVTSALLRLRTKIDNVQAKNNVKIQLNGVEVSAFNFTAGANGSKTADASLTLRPGVNTITLSATNTCGTDVETILVEYDNCLSPLVDITSSTNETTNNSYILTAAITNMSDAIGITVTRNGQDIGFNFSNGQLTSAVSLIPGVNTFVVKAVKSCGNASKTITVNYRDCEAPTLSILTPSAGISVNNAQTPFSARVTNIASLNQVLVTLNGQTVNSNLNADVISGNLSLVEGLNTLTIKLTNACGMDTKTVTLTRVACTPPTATILNPTQSITVTRAGLAFEATVLSATNYSVTLNGNAASVSKTGNTLRGNLTLVPGSNVIVLTANNACGNASETVIVTYNNCVAPVIALSGNAMQTVSTSTYAFSGTVTNSIQSAIAFTLNGVQKPFSLTGTNLSANLSLSEGVNILVISTSNACGSDTKTVTINYVIPVNNNGSNNGGNSGNTEEKIIICHYPPGNTGNPQQLEIPLSAWPAHQAHGDVLGPCPNVTNGNNGSNGNSGNNGSNNGGNSGNTEEKIIICHYPPGNTGNPQQLEIPLSAWPAHQAHGDVLGPCPNVNNGNNGSGNNGNNNSDGTGGNASGSNGTNIGSGTSGNGNNGHGNNEDGVDVSNPGQGSGGPNGTPDQSGNVDDESTGNGANSGTNSNPNGSTENGTGNTGNNGSGSQGGSNSGTGTSGNGNNGHGNNEDGVDVSNPGQGSGGPNGTPDQSGNVDEESTGNGANTGSNSNSNGTTENGTGNTGNNDSDAQGGGNSGTGNTGNNGSGAQGGGDAGTGISGSGTGNSGAGGNESGNGGNNQNGRQKSQQTGTGSTTTPTIKPNGVNQTTKPNGTSNSNNGGQHVNKPTVNTSPPRSPQNNKPSGSTNIKPQENNKPSGNGTSNSNNGGQQVNKPTVNSSPQGSPQNNKPSVSTNTKPQENNKPSGNGNQGTPTPKPTNNKPQVTNKPAQTGGVKPNPSGTKPEVKPNQNKPNEVKPNTGPKVNGTNKGGGK